MPDTHNVSGDEGPLSSDNPPLLGLLVDVAAVVTETPPAEPPPLGLAAEAAIELFINDSMSHVADMLSVEQLAKHASLPDQLLRPVKKLIRELKAPELFQPSTCEFLCVIATIIDRKTPARARLDNLVEYYLEKIEENEARYLLKRMDRRKYGNPRKRQRAISRQLKAWLEADVAAFDAYYAQLVSRTSNQGGATAESDACMSESNKPNDDDSEDIEPLNVGEESATQLNTLRKRLTGHGYFAANKLMQQLIEFRRHPTLTTRAEFSLMLDSIVELTQRWQPGNHRNSHKARLKNAVTQLNGWRDLLFNWRLGARERPAPKPIEQGLPWERLSLAGMLNRIDRVEGPFETSLIDTMIRDLEQLRDQLVPAQLVVRYNRLITPST